MGVDNALVVEASGGRKGRTAGGGLGLRTWRQKTRSCKRPVAYSATGRCGPVEREAIQSVLDGRDTLAVMPTDGGNSANYELSGSLPIRADRGDLASHCPAARPACDPRRGRATRSGLPQLHGDGARTTARHRSAFSRWTFSRLRLPCSGAAGQRRRAAVSGRAATGPVGGRRGALREPMGPDFRPDYLRIGPALEHLGRPTVLAVTATAAPPVRDEIVQRLNMKKPDVSGSLDEYYQEFGRAGRDGAPADSGAVLPRRGTWRCLAGTRRARDQAEGLSKPWRQRWRRPRGLP